MSGYPRLNETGLNTLAQALADATKLQGVIKVCETEAEWNQKTQAEKDDPNIYWFLPWRTSTSGEINDNTIAPDKVWSSQKVNSENTALKAMVTDDYVFSPSKAYVAGDWLIHNNILYEVLVACTGVTPPNSTYYKVKNLHDLQSEIDALNNELVESKIYRHLCDVTLTTTLTDVTVPSLSDVNEFLFIVRTGNYGTASVRGSVVIPSYIFKSKPQIYILALGGTIATISVQYKNDTTVSVVTSESNYNTLEIWTK